MDKSKTNNARTPVNLLSDSEFEKLLNEALDFYKKGIDGDAQAVKKSVDLFKKLNTGRIGDPLLSAYLGSATALLGRDEKDPIERFRHVIKGLKLLDKAVASTPENKDIRMMRASLCSRLPETYFHRTDTAIEDYSHLIAQHERGINPLDTEAYQQALYDLGTAYKTINKTREAASIFEKLAAASPIKKFRALLRQNGFGIPEPEEQAESPILGEPDNKKKEVTAKPTDMAKTMEEGIKLHNKALCGDKKAIKAAHDFFEKAYAQMPENALIQAYFADCISMQGGDADDSNFMFSNAIKAIKMLDEAVNCDPDDCEIRILRANQSVRLPEVFFKRTATAIKDIEYIIQKHEKGEIKLPKDMFCMQMYNLGKAYKRINMDKEAVEVWKKLLGITKDPKYSRLISKEMKEGMEKFDISFDTPADEKKVFKEATRIHDMAAAGNKTAAHKACEIFMKLHEAHPEVPIIEAYYGSSLALIGKYASDTQTMFGNTIKGMKLLNHAAESDTENIRVRLLRAYFLYNLPETFFHMTQKAIDDFKFLIEAYEKDHSKLPHEQYCNILYDLGECYDRLNDSQNTQNTRAKLLASCKGKPYEKVFKSKLERSEIK